MLETSGNIWEIDAELRGITTNGIRKKNGEATMGKGIALQAAQRYPALGRALGERLADSGNHVYVFSEFQIVSFPTKHHWRDPSDLKLIERSAHELREIVERDNYKSVILPPPGCGLGGLSWNQVKSVIEPYFDDRLTIVHYSGQTRV